MARYADTDKLKNDILTKYKKHWEVPCSAEDRLIQSIVTDLRVLIECNTTADVVPRAEVAKEIFEEIDKAIKEHSQGYCCDWYLYELIDKLKKKYTEGK